MKPVPRESSSSGIPKPCSLLPNSPKPDPRRWTCDRTSTKTPRHTSTHSPSLQPRNSNIPGPSSREHLRDAGQKNLHFQRTGAFNIPRISRSAYSSPLTQRREASPHSKDTLDLRKTAVAHIPSQFVNNKNRNRSTFTNNNQARGANNLHPNLRFRGGENSNSTTQKVNEALPTRGAVNPTESHVLESSRVNNGNVRPNNVHSDCKHTMRGHSGSTSQSDEEMGTSEDSSLASSPDPLPLPLISLTMPVMSGVEDEAIETPIPRINMATVAPFSYR